MNSSKIVLSIALLATSIVCFGQQPINLYYQTDSHMAGIDADSLHQRLLKTAGAETIQSLTIVGHTDNVGSTSYNDALGARRAQAIAREMQQFADLGNIEWKSAGELKPVASNNTEAGRSKNRRVEFQLVLTKSSTDRKAPELKQAVAKSTNQILPPDAMEPMEGCRAFFTGCLVADRFQNNWYSEAFKEDQFSEYVGAGSYHSLAEAMPKAVATTFDGIAVGAGTRVIIYSDPDFKGEVLLDVTGPALINNSMFSGTIGEGWRTRDFKPELQRLFPPESREWSSTPMFGWSNGSLKIMCASQAN